MKNSRAVIDAFNDSRIRSCLEVQNKAGLRLAIGFRSAPKTPQYSPKRKLKSVTNLSYRHQIQSHVGMPHKPMERYSPMASRSRLLTPSFIPPRKNDSQIEIGTPQYKKQFLTISQLNYKKPYHSIITHPGIVCELSRLKRIKNGL